MGIFWTEEEVYPQEHLAESARGRILWIRPDSMLYNHGYLSLYFQLSSSTRALQLFSKLLLCLMSSSLHSSFLQLPIQPASSNISARKPFCVGFRKRSSIVSAVSATETKRTNGFGVPIQMDSSSLSLYEVLGIPASASCREIKSAYRRLARTCHPDAVSLNRKETSANEFMKIHAAYSTLADPDKRATYDLGLFRHRTPIDSSVKMAFRSSPATGFSGHPSRNWETDQCW